MIESFEICEGDVHALAAQFPNIEEQFREARALLDEETGRWWSCARGVVMFLQQPDGAFVPTELLASGSSYSVRPLALFHGIRGSDIPEDDSLDRLEYIVHDGFRTHYMGDNAYFTFYNPSTQAYDLPADALTWWAHASVKSEFIGDRYFLQVAAFSGPEISVLGIMHDTKPRICYDPARTSWARPETLRLYTLLYARAEHVVPVVMLAGSLDDMAMESRVAAYVRLFPSVRFARVADGSLYTARNATTPQPTSCSSP